MMPGPAASARPRPAPPARGGAAAPVRRAYDAVAAAYDAAVAPSAWVRERLWQRLDALFAPGARVLDATAGTGCDAVHLAARGVAVTACDLSPAMLLRLAAKDPAIATRVADCSRLQAAGLGGPFDGVISTFAGLNTATDLDGFARGAAGLLDPEGILFVHLLNRWPVAELARGFRHRGLVPGCAGLAAAWRGARRVEIGGVAVLHRLSSPRRLYRRFFARRFILRRLSGQGVLRPVDDPAAGAGARLEPGERRPPPERVRRAERCCLERWERWERWERRLGAWPLSRCLGTFFTLEMRRRAGGGRGGR